jgi:hypothetical protein
LIFGLILTLNNQSRLALKQNCIKAAIPSFCARLEVQVDLAIKQAQLANSFPPKLGKGIKS